jgi:hypothetical protein
MQRTRFGLALLLAALVATPLSAQRPSLKYTYTGATAAKTATAAGTGPFFTICGSASRPITVQMLTVSGTVATAAVYGDVVLTKTSTATSGGTATALTQTPLDTLNRAGSSNAVNFYTALATAGTAVGKVGSRGAVFPITGTVAAQEAFLQFDWRPGMTNGEIQGIVLRGTAECLEAAFGTTTTNAPTLQVEVVWSEE